MCGSGFMCHVHLWELVLASSIHQLCFYAHLQGQHHMYICVTTFECLFPVSRSSKLRNGDHTLYLWEVDRSHLKVSRVQKSYLKMPIVEQEIDKFMSILAGPATNNPNHATVRVVMGLETTPTLSIPTHHIIHPSTRADGVDDYFRYIYIVCEHQIR